MESRYIPATVTLTASLITCIVCIIKQHPVVYSLELLLGTLVIFYIIGIIAKNIILKTVKADSTEAEEDSEEELTEEAANMEPSEENQE